MDSSEGAADTPGATGKAAQDSKPKRVRTGCLTCRQRHLKCDEGKPICQNCRKSNRTCVTGVRLNFIDTQVKRPPLVAPAPADYQIAFCDDSRDIASEYAGGLAKYGPVEDSHIPPDSNNMFLNMQQHSMPPPSSATHQSLPPIQGILPEAYPQETHDLVYEHQSHRASSHRHSSHSHSESSYTVGGSSYGGEHTAASNDAPRNYLDTQEEVLFMQVFVEEVGLWMDSMDPMKHFSRLLPFRALSEPMLLNAFLACGARHLALVNQKYGEDRALHYYDTATRYLLGSLQNPNRDSVVCATTAVILNVYEIMCERALQRMNHIAGARALIKECGWNARSTGIGAACFWLNIGMELLSCLHFNWQVAWHPDEWGLDMDFSRGSEPGREEIWTYRIVYLVAKIANFRATIPKNEEHMRSPERCNEWNHLKERVDAWNASIPRTMHPMAYLTPAQTISGSAFPEVWLIKRTSTVARLFYHTALCLLAQTNPLQGPNEPEMRDLLYTHARLICGICAHVKDRGVASVALRSLAIAAETLVNRREQEEVLQIFDRVRQETGWRVGFLNAELREKWGFNEQQQPRIQPVAGHVQQNQSPTYQQHQPLHLSANQPHAQPLQPSASLPPAPSTQPSRRQPMGNVNPLMATADFNMPHHPYQPHYVAPNPMHYAQNPLASQAPPSNYY